ncbi:MAG: hypothetical protein R3304_07770 [Longimicrobiales bacterium]|nr:hypothetical protein [Longimicrobiales bacterium]
MNELFFLFAWTVSGIGSILLAAVAVTYVRRTWQLIRAEEDEPTRDRLLDGMDHLQNQVHLMSRRLEGLEDKLGRIERRIGAGAAEGRPGVVASARPSGGEEDGDDSTHTDATREEHAP